MTRCADFAAVGPPPRCYPASVSGEGPSATEAVSVSRSDLEMVESWNGAVVVVVVVVVVVSVAVVVVAAASVVEEQLWVLRY